MNIPLNIDWQQILLHLMNFAVLAGGLYLLLYRPVKRFMDARAEHYRAMAAEAEAAKQAAETLRADYQEKLRAVEEEVRREKAVAQQLIQMSAQRQLDEAKRQAEQIIADANAAAERSRERILEESQKELKELALTAAEKLVLKSGGDAFDQFLDIAEGSDGNERL